MKGILILCLLMGSCSHKVEAKETVMQVQACRSGSWQTIGTAFAMNNPPGVMTAAHVSNARSNLRFCNSKNECILAGKYARGLNNKDWAFYPKHKTPRNIKRFYFARNPKVRTDVFAEGFPRGEYSVTKGIVSSVQRPRDNNLFLLDAYSLPGSSGGPVYIDKDNVVGIVSAIEMIGGFMPLGNRVLAYPVRDALNEFRDKEYVIVENIFPNSCSW